MARKRGSYPRGKQIDDPKVDGVCTGFVLAVEVSFETGAGAESGNIVSIVCLIAVRANSMVVSSLDPCPPRDLSSM
jgi:hypothetical protein